MGGIVLAVALVGWNGNSRLSKHIETISQNSIPSISGLWKINEGQTQIQSSERALVNPQLSRENRQTELTRIQQAWVQINEGFKEYELAPQVFEEAQLYKNKFQPDWERWKQDHEEFIQRYRAADVDGISATEAANLNQFLANEERSSFEVATEDMLKLLDINYSVATAAQKAATQDITRTSFWVVLGMIVGPSTAILFGIYFSRTIAKPLGAKIAGIVSTIVGSSTEIAATVEQQERMAAQQSVSVNQTTTTMDELGASSRQSAEQAEVAATGARQALLLAEDGTKVVSQTWDGMIMLKEKVGAIAEQILRLSEQTSQISNITNLVSDLANQTNMLALNAAVEAARAGDQGRGFAVVASEIRKLADQSKQSAERINGLVVDIQGAINSTVMVTDEGTKTVEKGMQLTQGTAQTFTGVADAINNVVLSSQQISLNTKQQAIAIQQVVDAMNSLNQGAAQTASGISQTKVGTQRLNEAAQNLKAVV